MLFIISGIAFASAMIVFLIVVSIGDEISQAGHTDSAAIHEVIIENDVLGITANMIRFPAQRFSGNHERVDIYALWPLMSGYSEENKSAFNMGKDSDKVVFITLERRSMSKDMAGRVIPIYSQFFEGTAQETSMGLTSHTLSKKSGYIDEDLYLETNSPYPFATRCIRETSKVSKPFCMRDIFVGRNLTLTYRFHKSLLPEWANLERMVRKRFNLMLKN